MDGRAASLEASYEFYFGKRKAMTKYNYDTAQDKDGVWRVRHLHGYGRLGFSYTSKHASEAEARAEAVAVKAMTERQIADGRARAVAQRARRKDAQGGPANA